MAHDWSGLLSEIEAFSARRAASLVDEGSRQRRAFGIAMSGEAQQRFVPTGIARKAGRGNVSSSEATIASILQVSQSSQQGVIALVGALGAGRDRDEEEEPMASAGGGRGSASCVAVPREARSTVPRQVTTDRSSAEIASRAAIAAGAQPAVIKVTSTVSNRASAAGLMTYLGTREVEKENGEKGKVDISIYDQDGVAISTREDRAAALAEWAADFREAYAVNALATFSIKLADEVDDAALQDALNVAFSSKPFLYSRHADGQVSVFAVTDLPAKRIAGALKAREKGEMPARAVENAEADFARQLADAGVSAEARILGAAVSKKSGRYFLEKFLRTETSITSEGDPVKRGSAIKEKADDIWRAWSSHIRTVEPRNAFHVIFSARAGTDPDSMTRAVRDFLSEQVAGHRWITAHHPETGHVHVHAMISARDDIGKALRLIKPELYEWRERFAVKARERGIAMVATRSSDVAATRPYSQAQAGAYERGRQDPRYLKTPTITNRVERKRAGVIDRASLTNSNLALAHKWQATSSALQQAGAEPPVIAAANRFAEAAATRKMPTPAPHAEHSVLVLNQEEQSCSLLGIASLVSNLKQPENRTVFLSLKQFDERVLRTNRSMDQLETMIDNDVEREAFKEMRQEILALFTAQRRDIERQQMYSASGAAQKPDALSQRSNTARQQVQTRPASIDPAIVAQQSIAEGRAARAAKELAMNTKNEQERQRQQMLRQAEQVWQREADRDGSER
ncbi:MAG: hypothetical protein DI546_05825 [Rhizobium sp.]|nr:MAG: hypothetical protein DI546_05825 [Rhizobium sp.]